MPMCVNMFSDLIPTPHWSWCAVIGTHDAIELMPFS